MPSFLTSALSFVAAIALLVAVHEYGHYIVARAVGIKVLRFSVGFGQVVWSRRGGADQTEYCLSAIPLGGYVKLLDERDCSVSFAERHRAFNRKPAWARIAVLFAGPAFNLAFAVLAYTVMFATGIPGVTPVVGTVAPGSIAATAGLREGETIVAVGGQPVATWEGATLAMLEEMLGNGTIRLELAPEGGGSRRAVAMPVAGRESELTEPGELFRKLGFEPWVPRPDAVIGQLTPGGAAQRAGLEPGDRILSVDGQPIGNWGDWVAYVRAHGGQSIQVTVQRGQQQLRLPVAVELVDSGEGPMGRIGAAVRLPEGGFEALRAEERYGLADAAGHAVKRTWDMSLLTLRMIWRMIVGDVSVKNISGPINIAQYAGYSASIGMAAFLSFLAVVSISLGVLNLLPVPMLDGGQIVYTLAEVFKGGPLSVRAQQLGQQVGIAFLLLLMTFAFYNDISRLLG